MPAFRREAARVALAAGFSLLAGACAGGGSPAVTDTRPDESPRLRAELRAAEDGRGEDTESMRAFDRGLASDDDRLRRVTVRALGRLERAELIPRIAAHLDDPAPSVRAEAANALGQSAGDSAVADAAGVIEARLRAEDDPEVRAALLRTLGRLRYDTVAAFDQVQLTLLTATGGQLLPPVRLGLAKALESLARRAPEGAALSSEAVERLRALGDMSSSPLSSPDDELPVRVRRLATAALASARVFDTRDADQAFSDPDEQVRRLGVVGVSRATEGADRQARLLAALTDQAAMVRVEALRALGTAGADGRACAPVIGALDDTAMHVRLMAVDVLSELCAGEAAVDARLDALVSAGEYPADAWHLPAHALVALAGRDATRAAAHLAAAQRSPVWQVRMYAARAAAVIGASDVLRTLAADPDPNVAQAAVAGLSSVDGPEAGDMYIAALERADYQLVLTAARALEKTPARTTAIPALLSAMERLTLEKRETSRDPRLAMLDRLEELDARNESHALEAYLRDFDPAVAERAASMLTEWTGSLHTAAPRPLERADLSGALDLPETATITLARLGVVELRLFPDEAPASVQRFVRRAREGYFDGLGFHRVAPNFVIQGGSPSANEYSGDSAFTRDELGLRSHTRGTVGISTRGRDTGDGQIFVNLADNDVLDHNYTIIGEVVEGMDIVDEVLEGDVIERVTVPGP